MVQTHMVKVGMADLNVLEGNGIIKTTGLGSCVGLTLYDGMVKVSGMAHIMLPDSSIARDASPNRAKYADTAIPELIERMAQLGASPRRMRAKLAGGAQMFAFSIGNSDMMRIGPRNVETCKQLLAQFNIPVIGEDTGGNYGRTIELIGESGILVVRGVNIGVKEL